MIAARVADDDRADGRLIARTLGWLFLAGPGIGLLTLFLPEQRFAHRPVFVAVCATALAIGAVLLSGRADRWPAWGYQVLGYITTVMVSLGVYFVGAPSSGFHFFYLWATPYAYRFFPLRQAAAQTGFVVIASGVVLALQSRQHPELGAAGQFVSWWLVSTATIVMVGILVRGLTVSLRGADARFRQGFASSPIGVLLLRPDLTIVDANDAAARIARRSVQQLLGIGFDAILHPDDVETGVAAARAALGGVPLDLHQRIIHADGSVAWVRCTGQRIADAGEELLFVHVVDVSAERHSANLLRWQATHDPLTALPNRLGLLERMGELLVETDESHPLAVMVADLDRFRLFNERFGHRTGDLVLQELAGRVTAVAGDEGIAARAGGDAFAVAVAVATVEDADELGRRLVAALAEPVRVDGSVHRPTATVGLAVATGPRNPENLLWDAQTAVARAKEPSGEVRFLSGHPGSPLPPRPGRP